MAERLLCGSSQSPTEPLRALPRDSTDPDNLERIARFQTGPKLECAKNNIFDQRLHFLIAIDIDSAL
jgi:hypothetical protein